VQIIRLAEEDLHDLHFMEPHRAFQDDKGVVIVFRTVMSLFSFRL
jgi:hypothetical protein